MYVRVPRPSGEHAIGAMTWQAEIPHGRCAANTAVPPGAPPRTSEYSETNATVLPSFETTWDPRPCEARKVPVPSTRREAIEVV